MESVGEHVEEVKEGDLVVPVFLPNCGECRDCESPKSNNCSKFGNERTVDMPRDGTSRFRDMNGEVVHNLFGISSFSEYTVVDVTHVVKIRHDFPLDKACLLSCGVSTGNIYYSLGLNSMVAFLFTYLHHMLDIFGYVYFME